MSDYLSNLVARNLGWANTVQPRGRSLFEPPAEVTKAVCASPQLAEIVPSQSIPSTRGLEKQVEQGSRGRENIAHPSSLATLSTSTPTPAPTVRGEQLPPPTEISFDLAHDSVPQETVLEPIATPDNPPQLQRQINTPTAQPHPARLIQQESRGRENSTEPNSRATQPTNSQPLSPFSPAAEPSTLSPANTTAKKDAVLPEPSDISPDLTQPLPPELAEEQSSVKLVGEDLPTLPPSNNVELREVDRLDSRQAEERKISSVYPNDIESSPSKIQPIDSELISSFSPMPKPSTLRAINLTVNREKELIEEPSWELTSNSPSPELAQPFSEPTSIPAETSRAKVSGSKSVEFLEAEQYGRESSPEREQPLAKPIAKVAQPQVTSLVTNSRSPSKIAAEQPTIRVSIGRIEVQAIAESTPLVTAEDAPLTNVPPEPPPAPSQPATPRLSLEEYLKSRRGDRR